MDLTGALASASDTSAPEMGANGIPDAIEFALLEYVLKHPEVSIKGTDY